MLKQFLYACICFCKFVPVKLYFEKQVHDEINDIFLIWQTELKITRDTRVTNISVEKLHVLNFYSQNRNFALLFPEDRKTYNNILAVYESLQ